MPNNPITLEALAVLDAIDSRGSYAAAAEQLNKVPSALSYIVQKLEEQLDVTIFQKQGRRAVLTPAGKHLLNEGRPILRAVNLLSDNTKAIATGWEPKLRIAIDSVLDPTPIFHALNEFLHQHPAVEIDTCEEVLNGSWESLIEDKVDLLIGAPPPVPKQKGIHAVVVGEFNPVFVVPSQHPLTQCAQPISREQIAQYRTIVVHDSAKLAVPWTRGVVSDSQNFFVPSMEYKIKAHIAGIGCGFLPRRRAQPYLDSGELIELAVETPLVQTDLYMAWKVVNRGKGLQQVRDMLSAAQPY